MPANKVHRYSTAAAVAPSLDGAQFVDGDLVIESAPAVKPVFKLTHALYPTTAQYVLFKYGGSVVGSLSDLTVDDSDLALSQVNSVVNDTVNKQVVLTLQSRSTNGTQYVDGDLNVTAPVPVVLSKTLVKTAGTYVLFDVGGTISGGTLANLQVQIPTGRALDPAQSPNPYIDGNQIKIKLL